MVKLSPYVFKKKVVQTYFVKCTHFYFIFVKFSGSFARLFVFLLMRKGKGGQRSFDVCECDSKQMTFKFNVMSVLHAFI